MAVLTLIDLGIPNDGTGDPLRVGGSTINDNFAAINSAKVENGGYSGTAQEIADSIANLDASLTSLEAIINLGLTTTVVIDGVTLSFADGFLTSVT